jgi:hypothetical protein
MSTSALPNPLPIVAGVEVESSARWVARSDALGGQGEGYSPQTNDLLGDAAAVAEIAARTLVASRFT